MPSEAFDEARKAEYGKAQAALMGELEDVLLESLNEVREWPIPPDPATVLAVLGRLTARIFGHGFETMPEEEFQNMLRAWGTKMSRGISYHRTGQCSEPDPM